MGKVKQIVKQSNFRTSAFQAENRDYNSLAGTRHLLAKACYTDLSTLYDNSHRPVATGTGERAAVVHFGWFEGNAFAAAQANHPFRVA